MTLSDTLTRLELPARLQKAARQAPPWVCVLLVALIAWQLARATWMVLAPPAAPTSVPPAPASQTGADNGAAPALDVSAIVDAHLFGRARSPDAAPAPEPDPVEVPETRLNLSLRGVIAGDDPGRGVAIIADNRGDEKLFRVEQRLPGGATLHAVHFDQVIINRNGRLETLRLPREFPGGTTPVSRNDGAARPRSGAASAPIQRVISDNAARITDVLRVQPYMDGGQMRGYRVFPGRNRDQFAQLGLQAGDLVTEINGTPLSDPARGMEIFGQLGDATEVSLTVERDGSTETMMLDTARLARAAEASE